MTTLQVAGRRLVRALGALWLVGLTAFVVLLGVAWAVGWKLDVVESRSMAPAVPAGSLAVVEPAGAAEIVAGDVVSFRDPGDRGHTVLHRVVEVIHRDGGSFLVTKGDANRTRDPLAVPASDVRGELGWSIPRLGALVEAAGSPLGATILIGGPASALAVSEVRRLRARREAGTVVSRPA